MTIEKLLENTQPLAELSKINEIIDELNNGTVITVDTELNEASPNPVQNAVITSALGNKQNTLTAGTNISISNDGVISATDTVYTAGTGISISNEGVISNTQTSAEWGAITGSLSEQSDLVTALSNKQDTLTAGTGIDITNNTISATGNYGYSATCPALTQTDGIVTWEITHNLGTQNLLCTLYNGSKEVSKRTIINSNNVITITFKSNVDVVAGDYKVVILSNGSAGISGSPQTDENFIPKDTVLHVELDGSGDFTTFKGALDYLVGKYSNGVVNIHIGTGTFNIPDNFTITGDSFNISNINIYGNGMNNTILSCDGNVNWVCGVVVYKQQVSFSDLSYIKTNGSRTEYLRGFCITHFATATFQNVKFTGCADSIMTSSGGNATIEGHAEFYNTPNAMTAITSDIHTTYGTTFVFNNVATALQVLNGGRIGLENANKYTATNVGNIYGRTVGTFTADGFICAPDFTST